MTMVSEDGKEFMKFDKDGIHMSDAADSEPRFSAEMKKQLKTDELVAYCKRLNDDEELSKEDKNMAKENMLSDYPDLAADVDKKLKSSKGNGVNPKVVAFLAGKSR